MCRLILGFCLAIVLCHTTLGMGYWDPRMFRMQPQSPSMLSLFGGVRSKVGCIGENQRCGTDEGFDCCGDEVECEVYITTLGRECQWDGDWVCTETERKHGRCVNNCRGQHVICSDSSECCKGLTCRSPFPWVGFTTCLEPAPTPSHRFLAGIF